MNYSPLTSEIGSKIVKSDRQGLEYRKKYNNITGENKCVEGFSNLFGTNSVDTKNKSDLDEVLKLQKEYQKKLSDYSKTYNLLMGNVNDYFNLRKSPLLNKNIRLTDGTIGYVTKEGIFKPYPNMEVYNNTAGINNCPKEWTQVEASIINGKVTTTPNFIVGQPMESEQSCGFEGRNVFSVNTGTPGKDVYKGCFKVPNSSNDLVYQQGLGENTTFEKCKQLAHDSGSSVFALNGSALDKLKCYIGSSIDSIRANGPSTKPVISWESAPNMNAINATINGAGQLVVKGNVSVQAQSNLSPGLTFSLYRGYMSDDEDFFYKTNRTALIATGISRNFSSISAATNNRSDNNSTKISIQWLGYLKTNINENVTISMTSDDCSYMWLGSDAISNYYKPKAFINNGGLHGPIKKSNTISLIANTYYPIRIQFGQNMGPGAFSLSLSSQNVQFLTTPTPFSSNIVKPEDKVTVLGELWKANQPIAGCDPVNGGNAMNIEATWGYNCNSERKPDGGSYNVSLGNYTDVIKTSLKNSRIITIGRDLNDPAYLCKKDFSAKYNCGSGPTKSIYLPGEAGGRWIDVDCQREKDKCLNFLILSDSGNILILSWEQYVQMWVNKNITFGEDWVDIPNQTDENITWKSNTNKIGISNSSKKASNGKNKRNYLLSGETLEDGEFIGSPTGKCYLQMIKGRGLVLMYDVTNCQNINGKIYGTSNPPDNLTAASYIIPENDLSNFYKSGYVDRNSNLRPYSKSMLTKSDKYAELGNYKIDGTGIKTIETADVNVCKIECNKDSTCDGFTYSNGKCDLRNSSNIYPYVKRYSDSNTTLYKRLEDVKNNGSCSKEVFPISIDLYSGYVEGDDMTSNTVCGLGLYNKQYYDKLKIDFSSLQEILDVMNSKLSVLSSTDKKILEQQGISENKLRKDIISINEMRNKYLEFKPQFETTKGMVDNTEDDMISKSYYNILWSILAIMIVIGGIKMSR
jgi:hypothetical protein